MGAVVATGALALAGCGGDDSTSATTGQSRAVESAVARAIDEQLSTPTAEVTGVGCPDDVRVGVGATFTCSVRWSNGAAGKAEVTPASLTKVAYEVVPGSVTVPRAPVELSVEQVLATQGTRKARVTCPVRITVKLGTSVGCRLRDQGGRPAGTVTFTFSGETGTVDPSSVKASAS